METSERRAPTLMRLMSLSFWFMVVDESKCQVENCDSEGLQLGSCSVRHARPLEARVSDTRSSLHSLEQYCPISRLASTVRRWKHWHWLPDAGELGFVRGEQESVHCIGHLPIACGNEEPGSGSRGERRAYHLDGAHAEFVTDDVLRKEGHTDPSCDAADNRCVCPHRAGAGGDTVLAQEILGLGARPGSRFAQKPQALLKSAPIVASSGRGGDDVIVGAHRQQPQLRSERGNLD